MDKNSSNNKDNKKPKLKEVIQKKKEGIKSFINNALLGEKTYNKIYDKIINFVKVFIVASRKFMVDDCLTKASSTAYTIIVSFIPTLTVVLTFYTIFSGVEGQKDELFRRISLFMVEHNIKINIDPVFSAISGLVDNAASIGGIGAVIMIFSATAMLRSLEKSLNSIWKVKKMRSFLMKIVFYWAALTLGPAMLIAGTTVATKVTEFFSSPDYNSAYITKSNRMWVVGSKSNILYSDKNRFKFKKITTEMIDFDNQRVYKYDKELKDFTLSEIRFEPLEYKSVKFKDIQFIGKEGWVVGNKGILLHTNSGGATWTLRKLDDYKLNDIYMINDKRGFIAANNGIILSTEDGGKTWKLKEWPGVTANFVSITFNKNLGIITGSRGTILYTDTKGEKWDLKIIEKAKRKDKYVDINNAFFINSSYIWLNGDEGINLFSSNRGKNWVVKRFKEYDYHASYFFNKNKGFIAGSKGRIIYTEDGGENWKIDKLETYKINKIIYKDKKLWVFGDTGLIKVSDNNGKTWSGMEGKSFIAMLINFFAPFLFIWLLFAFTYMAMPNTKVPFKFASLGAAFTGALWVAFILLFIYYIKAFAKGTFAIYGTLASIPLFLLMIYSSTVIVLYGAEVAYTLMYPDTYRNLRKTLKGKKNIYVYHGIAILYYIYKKFEKGRGPTTEKELISITSQSSEEAELFLNIFMEENLIIKNEDSGYVPANSSQNVKISDVIDMIHNISLEIPGTVKTSGLKNYVREIFIEIALCRNKVIGDTTLKEVIGKV